MQGVTRISERRIEESRDNPPMPDPDAVYAGRIVLDLAEVTPHVSGPDTVQVMQSVAEIEKKKIAIQKAYLVSCVNSRLEDLAAAAKVLEGKKIATSVRVLSRRSQPRRSRKKPRNAASGKRSSPPERNRCLPAAGRVSAWAPAF